eukprot:579473_1
MRSSTFEHSFQASWHDEVDNLSCQSIMTHCVLSACQSAIRINEILWKHNDNMHMNEINDASDQIVFTNSYIQLLNDFYHIKYDHNTNNDTHQFDAFYQYLCDKDNPLQCDIRSCRAAQIYNARSSPQYVVMDEHNQHINNIDTREFNLMCMIHVYFLHSSDISRSKLTNHELQWIEQQLNECKDDDEHDKLNELLFIRLDKIQIICADYSTFFGVFDNLLQCT